MNSEKKPLIYLLNTPSTVEKKLSPNFNISHYWMNGFKTFESSSFHGIEIPYSYDLPANLHEAEIVVIDTGLRASLINGPSSFKVVYRHTPSVVDFFPLDMITVLKNIFSTNKLQILILFCESYNNETYVLEGESGRQSSLPANTYGFPDYHSPSIKSRSGSRMKTASGGEGLAIKQCIEKYLPNSNYNYTFNIRTDNNSSDIPLILNEADEVVSFIRVMGNKITFFLPEIDEKDDFLFEMFDKVLPDIPKFCDIFPNHGSFKWMNDFSYISLEERNKMLDIEEEYKRHEKSISSLKEEYEKIHHKDENIKLRNMLKETGDELVLSVKWFLEFLGFTDIVDPDKDVDVDAGDIFEEDLNFEYDGIKFLLEVKGIGGTSTDSQCAQISKIALRRKKLHPSKTHKAIYIVNHRRYKAPKERELIPFNDNQIIDAEIANRGMTFTYELFNIYHMIQAGIISKSAVREAFKQEGLIDFRYSLNKVDFNHCYKGLMVYSLIIPVESTFTISKSDKIAIQDKENHWHLLKIESIQVDNQTLEEVSNGTVGIKVDRLVLEARDFYVVNV